MKKLTILIISSTLLSFTSVADAQKPDPVADAKKICHYQAVKKSDYNPEKKASLAIQLPRVPVLAPPWALRFVPSRTRVYLKAQLSVLLPGRQLVVKNNKDKKQVVLGEANYKTEYDNCVRSRGLVPENVR